jgi:hypothetical protein
MKKKLFTLLMPLFAGTLFLHSTDASATPSGELFGYVKDSATTEPIPFAVVVVKSGETVISGAQADEKGIYKISGIPPGTYTAVATYSNYPSHTFTNVVINAEKTTRLDFILSPSILDAVIVTTLQRPLIDPQDVSNSFIMDQKDLDESPLIHNVTDLAAMAPTVYQRDAGQPINIGGSRSDATAYMVDGVKIVGSPSVPSCAIEQVSVFTGGIPAEFGDATGGFVIITTKSYFTHRSE